MGYALDLVNPMLGPLNDLAQQMSNVDSTLTQDAQVMVYEVEDLAGCASGPTYDALNNVVTLYNKQMPQWLDPLTQVRDAAKRFHDSVEQASQNLDAKGYPSGIDGEVIQVLFQNLQLNDVLTNGGDNINQELLNAYYAVESQQSSSGNLPVPLPSPTDFTYAYAPALVNWANALRDADRQWQTAVGVHTYEEDSIPSLPGIKPDPNLVAGITNQFNALDSSGQINSTPPDGFTNPITPQEYQQVVSTFHDPRTQECILLLMTTPTGAQFAQYLLYMGKKLGGDNFIQWNLNEQGAAGDSTNGYIELSASYFESAGPAALAATLVHEGVETYYDVGPGIRQMGTVHADYVAEWYAGKFLSELSPADLPNLQNATPTEVAAADWRNTAYGQPYNCWKKSPDGQSYVQAGETENVDLSQAGDEPGVAWNYANHFPDWLQAWWSGKQVGSPPNPMGLKPHMLTTGDMNTFDPVPPGYYRPCS